jgi:hypothetical protein
MSFLLQKARRVARRMARRLSHRIDDWLIDLSTAQDARLHRRALLRLLFHLRLVLMYLLYGQEGAVEFWQGEESAGGQPLRVAYIGIPSAAEGHSPEYLRHILFRAGTARVEARGPCPMRRARQAAQALAAEADLVIVDRSPLQRWSPTGGGWLVTPVFVRMAFDLDPSQPWQAAEARMAGQKHNLSLVRRHGYTLRCSRDPADFDFFYERMHIPMMQARHGDYGVLEGKNGLLEQFRRGHVMLVELPGQGPVAGALNTRYGPCVFGIVSGTLDGDMRWHKQGALSALYYLTLRWCHENGVTRFDNGYCRPFESDGPYRHKRRWGMHPVPDPWPLREWLFWVPHGAPAALEWLRANPPVHSERLRGTLVEPPAPKAARAGAAGSR